MSAVIVMSPDELRMLIREVVRAELRDLDPREHESEWLDAGGAADLLGVTRRTVTRMARSGELPASRVGEKLYRFRRRDLEAYLARRQGAA